MVSYNIFQHYSFTIYVNLTCHLAYAITISLPQFDRLPV